MSYDKKKHLFIHKWAYNKYFLNEFQWNLLNPIRILLQLPSHRLNSREKYIFDNWKWWRIYALVRKKKLKISEGVEKLFQKNLISVELFFKMFSIFPSPYPLFHCISIRNIFFIKSRWNIWLLREIYAERIPAVTHDSDISLCSKLLNY